MSEGKRIALSNRLAKFFFTHKHTDTVITYKPYKQNGMGSKMISQCLKYAQENDLIITGLLTEDFRKSAHTLTEKGKRVRDAYAVLVEELR